MSDTPKTPESNQKTDKQVASEAPTHPEDSREQVRGVLGTHSYDSALDMADKLGVKLMTEVDYKKEQESAVNNPLALGLLGEKPESTVPSSDWIDVPKAPKA